MIVIFGAAVRPDGSASGAMRGRVRAALETGRRLDDPVYMPTGGVGRYGPAEAEVMATLLRRAGVHQEAIRPEPTGRNTIRSVLACARLIGPGGVPVFVATSAYHMIRCVALLRLAGIRAWPGCAPTAPASRSWRKRWFWRLREIPALPVDAALLLLRIVTPKHVTPAKQGSAINETHAGTRDRDD